MVNVLSTFPFLSPEERRDHISDLPLAIMEVRSGKLDFLYTNGAFQSLLQSLGVAGLQGLLDSLSHLDEQADQLFWRLINQAVNTGEEQQVEQSVHGHIFTLRIKCIANNRENHLSAIALIADNLTPAAQTEELTLA